MTAFIDERRSIFGVEVICRELSASRPAYYRRATGERRARAASDGVLLDRTRAPHAENHAACGTRRGWNALLREGVIVGRDRVRRLMRQAGLMGAKPWRTMVLVPGTRSEWRSTTSTAQT